MCSICVCVQMYIQNIEVDIGCLPFCFLRWPLTESVARWWDRLVSVLQESVCLPPYPVIELQACATVLCFYVSPNGCLCYKYFTNQTILLFPKFLYK